MRGAAALDRFFGLKYALRQEEVEVSGPTVSEADDALKAYLVREEPREGGSYSAGHGVMLLPDASGWRSPRTRRLADRLAVFCSCLVLIPDLQRGSRGWDGPATSAGGFESWLSGLPPNRVDSDLRECTVFMRADLRVRRMGLVGLGLGGGQAIREATRDAALLSSTAVAICPIRFPVDSSLEPKVPLLCVFDEASKTEAQEVREWLGGGRADGHNDPTTLVVDSVLSVSTPEGERSLQGARRANKAGMPSVSALMKLKVAEIRAKLMERRLPTSGLKKVVATRLHNALVAEATSSGKPKSRSAAASLTTEHLVVELAGAEWLCSTLPGSELDSEEEEEEDGWDKFIEPAPSQTSNLVGSAEGEDDGDELAGVGMVEGSDDVVLELPQFDADDETLNDVLLMIEGWLTAHLHANAPVAEPTFDGASPPGDEEDEFGDSSTAFSATDARAMETAEEPPARSEEIRRPRAAGDLVDGE